MRTATAQYRDLICRTIMLLFAIGGIGASASLAAQALAPEPLKGCLTTQVNEQLLARRPELRAQEVDREAAWRKSQSAPVTKSLPATYTLPIVFHIIHNGGPENISDADVLRSLDFANQAFANVGYFDQGTGADTGIEFCLARRTPDNQPTNGIKRVQSPLTDLQATDDEVALKDLSRFDTRKYINVWVVDEICGLGFGCGVAGYAYYPGAHGMPVDGIVVEARGLTGGEAGVTTLIHELGHYLGLAHTFDGGCKNDDCLQDGDRVCDTPPDASRAGVPCGGSANSCTTDVNSGFTTDQDDHYYNYMDYGRQDCRSEFTPGQGDRMEFFLTGRRRSLLASLGCQAPCPAPITASFTGGDVTVEVGTTVNFVNTGNNGDNFTWSVNEVDEQNTADFTRQFTEEGFFRVQLVVTSNDPLCEGDSVTQRVRVVCTSQNSFTLPDTIREGQSVTFTNTSSPTVTEQWTVNGAPPAATGRNLTFTFPAPGVYDICLATDFGFCEERRCRLVFVSREPCVGDDCPGQGEPCTPPFSATFEEGDFGRDTRFTTVLHAPTGYYVGGGTQNGPYVAFFDANLNQVWHTELYPNQYIGPVVDMLIDDMGNLACVTRGLDGPSNFPGNFAQVFNVDGATGAVNWAFEYGESSTTLQLNAIVQPGPGQDYMLLGNLNQSGNGITGVSQGVVLRVDPLTGGVSATSKRYVGREFLDFQRARYDAASNSVFTAVLERRGNSIISALARLDPAGNLVFSRQLTRDAVPGATDVAVLPGRAVTMAEVSSVGQFQTQFSAIDLDGTFLWSTTLPIVSGFRAHSLQKTNTGFAYLGRNTSSDDLLLLYFDPNGTLLNGKIYSDQLLFSNATRSLDAVGDQLLVVGNRPLSGGLVPTMMLLRDDGSLAEECQTSVDIFPDLASNDPRTSLTQYNDNPFQISRDQFFWEPIGDLLTTVACRDTCPDDTGEPGGPMESDPEICNNQIDDDGDGLTDCEDPELRFTCCCLPAQMLTLGPDSTLCDNVPIKLGVADTFTTYRWSTGETSDSISVFAPGTYWLTATDSCGFVATDTLTLHQRQRPSNLDLGPDRFVCDNAVVPLVAPPGYANYRWVDGTGERTFTAFAAGEYWVEVTDSCGRTQRDTVRVIIAPATKVDLGPDTTICLGQDLVFSLSGFNNYQWTNSSYLDCDDCPTVRFAPERDTMLFVAAELRLGCISTDTIHVRVTDQLPGSTLTRSICPGDSLLFDGLNRGAPGTYVATVAADCFAPDTLQLRFADAPALTTETTAQDCGGAAAGAGRVTVGATSGPVNILWSTGATTSEVTGLAAGVYGVTVTDEAGCPAVDSIVVAPSRVPPLTLQVEAESCPGAGDGRLLIVGDSLGLEYQLAGGPVRGTPFFDSLAVGSYTLRAGIAGGCDTTYEVTIGGGQGYAFDLGPDRSVRLGDSVSIAPLGPVPDSLVYRIRSAQGDTCTNCPALTLRPAATTEVVIISTTTGGCVIGDEIRLIVDRRDLVYIPSAFSPNGDGANDRFRIYPGPGVVAIESLEVYQRWGGRVFRSDATNPADELAGWDGRLNGRLMNPAVFVYQAKVRLFTGEVVSFVGDVVLVR